MAGARLVSVSASSEACTQRTAARLNSTCSRTCQSSAREIFLLNHCAILFFSPGGRGLTVPMAATFASAASRAWRRGSRSAAATPSTPSPFSGCRARTRSRIAWMAAVNSSSSKLAAIFAFPACRDFGKDSAARCEIADDLSGMRFGGGHDIGEHPVDHVLLKNTQVAIGERVHFERFEFEAKLIGHVPERQSAVVGKAGFGADRGELGHRDFDLVSGFILIRPGLDFRKFGMYPGSRVVVSVLTLHCCDSSACWSNPRNWPTSVTTPTACPVPRSLTLVATAGLISTQTIFTQLGSMLPVAMECSIEPRHSTSPAPRSCSAYASCARFISVIVSGKGPSSRRLPASTNGTW